MQYQTDIAIIGAGAAGIAAGIEAREAGARAIAFEKYSEPGGAAITMMIHEEGGSDFKAELSSDVPGLSLKAERGPKRDRYQVEITLVSEKVRPGPMKGSIVINTNDAEFPRIIVPVSGQIVDR